MIDLVHWSFVAALLPIVLQVCVRILWLVYWSLRAFAWPYFALSVRNSR